MEKLSLLDRFKLWLWKRMEVWYERKRDELFSRNRVLRDWISMVIEADFGKKCPELNLSCATCQAHLALDILLSLYWDDEDSPMVFNKSLHDANTIDDLIKLEPGTGVYTKPRVQDDSEGDK